MCGCDYCDSIKGIGPKTALKLLYTHGDIETIIENIPKKYVVPSSLEDNIEEIRNLFKNPTVISADKIEIKFGKLDKEAIFDFLVGQRGFSKERVTKVMDRITGKVKVKVDEKQPTIDTFFKKKV